MSRSFTFLVKFIPRYDIVFATIINGIDLLIYLSDSLLLVYRNESDFSMLILYPATLVDF